MISSLCHNDFKSLSWHFSHAAQTNDLQGLHLYETFFSQWEETALYSLYRRSPYCNNSKSNLSDLEIRESIVKETDSPM